MLISPSFLISLGVFLLVAMWESYRPTISLTVPNSLRWFNNFLWLIISNFFLITILPVVNVVWAQIVVDHGWGVLLWLNLPIWIMLPIGILAMDLVAYALHVLEHKSPLLWRLHAIHHSDINFDCTTGVRFHPLEGVVSVAVRMAAITALGVPPIVVLTFEFWLVLQNLYGHANARLPARMERFIRCFVVTPDMHRIHHSIRLNESLRNYGIIIPWWDRLFCTYLGSPQDGHENMRIGLNWMRNENIWSVPKLLFLPFQRTFPSDQQVLSESELSYQKAEVSEQ